MKSKLFIIFCLLVAAVPTIAQKSKSTGYSMSSSQAKSYISEFLNNYNKELPKTIFNVVEINHVSTTDREFVIDGTCINYFLPSYDYKDGKVNGHDILKYWLAKIYSDKSTRKVIDAVCTLGYSVMFNLNLGFSTKNLAMFPYEVGNLVYTNKGIQEIEKSRIKLEVCLDKSLDGVSLFRTHDFSYKNNIANYVLTLDSNQIDLNDSEQLEYAQLALEESVKALKLSLVKDERGRFLAKMFIDTKSQISITFKSDYTEKFIKKTISTEQIKAILYDN